MSSLIEEAITSSQLEGATTTRREAESMIRTGRPPKSRSERMVLNNFRTLQRLRDMKGAPLTPELVLDIHRWITDQTLDAPAAAGRLRLASEPIRVEDVDSGEVLHVPPPAGQLPGRMQALCDFANGKTPERYVHPAVRSILLHFWLAYDHPFVDGNGRTARALFYWSMLRHGYWLAEYISISHVILRARAQYRNAFLYTETDDNDATYFILYHVGVIRKAVDELHAYISRKTGELRDAEARLQGMEGLNPRQRMLVSHALRHPRQTYTIESHRLSHSVVYQTARTDLLDLSSRGLLRAEKAGKAWHFTPVPDLEKRLAQKL